MKYRDIEIEWMKELLKENEVEIARLRKERRKLEKELHRIKNYKILWKTVEEWENDCKEKVVVLDTKFFTF